MKTLTNIINEFKVQQHLTKTVYKPKTRDELIANIKTELNDENTDLNCIDTSLIEDMSYIFNEINGDINLSKIDISNWKVSNVKTMEGMFYNCFNLTGLGDISKWDVSSVTNLSKMFYNCRRLRVDINDWNFNLNKLDYKSRQDIFNNTRITSVPNWGK